MLSTRAADRRPTTPSIAIFPNSSMRGLTYDPVAKNNVAATFVYPGQAVFQLLQGLAIYFSIALGLRYNTVPAALLAYSFVAFMMRNCSHLL
jgi:hypothetical protein